MSFLDDFSRKYFSATEVDAIRALRPSGPLDAMNATLKCTRCLHERTETLRWFHLNDTTCTCGGLFDDKPLRDALVNMTVNHLMKTHTPEEIIEILKNGDGK